MTQQNTISAKMIRTAFESPDYPQLFSGKETHNPALFFIKSLTPYLTERNQLIELIKTGLPENYDGDTLNEISGMSSWALDKGFDKDTDSKEGESQAQLLINLINNENYLFFHNDLKEPYIVLTQKGKRESVRLSSRKSKLHLRHIFYKKFGRPISDQPFKQALDILAAKAIFDNQEEQIFLRMAKPSDDVIINLANEDKEAVLINKDGFRVLNESPINFISSPAMKSLPIPILTDRNALRKFQRLLGLKDNVFYSVLAFLINSLKPYGPYFCLIIEGEQGSGKSFLAECIKELIDPSKASKLRMPSNERDLMIIAKDTYLPVFDNVSGIKGDISDALCSLSTGSGFATRKLYTDDEVMIFSEARPYILNGISSYANRPDLLERAIFIHLESMPDDKRKTESEMKDAFEKLKPAILSELYSAISYALKNYDSTPTPKKFRMADAAKWILAAEPATNLPENTLLDAIEQSQNEVFLDSLLRNSLAVALMDIASKNPFHGTVGSLFAIVNNMRPSLSDKYFPSSSAHLSRALDRLKPPLLKADVVIEFGNKTRKGRMIRVYLKGDEGKQVSLSDHPLTPIEM